LGSGTGGLEEARRLSDNRSSPSQEGKRNRSCARTRRAGTDKEDDGSAGEKG